MSVKRKAKTCKTAAKRFKITAGGKILRGHVGHSHLLEKKSSRRKRRIVSQTVVDASDQKRIKRLLKVK